MVTVGVNLAVSLQPDVVVHDTKTVYVCVVLVVFFGGECLRTPAPLPLTGVAQAARGAHQEQR